MFPLGWKHVDTNMRRVDSSFVFSLPIFASTYCVPIHLYMSRVNLVPTVHFIGWNVAINLTCKTTSTEHTFVVQTYLWFRSKYGLTTIYTRASVSLATAPLSVQKTGPILQKYTQCTRATIRLLMTAEIFIHWARATEPVDSTHRNPAIMLPRISIRTVTTLQFVDTLPDSPNLSRLDST